MAGMKYSPGFDDPSARPKLARSRSFVVAATLLGVGVGLLAVLFLSPSLLVDLGGALHAGAQLLGLE